MSMEECMSACFIETCFRDILVCEQLTNPSSERSENE